MRRNPDNNDLVGPLSLSQWLGASLIAVPVMEFDKSIVDFQKYNSSRRAQ